MLEISRFVISLLTRSKLIFEFCGSTLPSMTRPGVVSNNLRTGLPFSSTPFPLIEMSCAVDCGLPINPLMIDAQVQGGTIFGLTAALYGQITLKDGRVEQSNFHDYQILRMTQVPPIEVHLIRNGESPGGIGEAGVTSALPALRNAVYAATGVALRRMPIDSTLLAKKTSA